MFEAFVTEELAHVGPVFLLTVGVVVLAVGSAARPGHSPRPTAQVFVQGQLRNSLPFLLWKFLIAKAPSTGAASAPPVGAASAERSCDGSQLRQNSSRIRVLNR